MTHSETGWSAAACIFSVWPVASPEAVRTHFCGTQRAQSPSGNKTAAQWWDVTAFEVSGVVYCICKAFFGQNLHQNLLQLSSHGSMCSENRLQKMQKGTKIVAHSSCWRIASHRCGILSLPASMDLLVRIHLVIAGNQIWQWKTSHFVRWFSYEMRAFTMAFPAPIHLQGIFPIARFDWRGWLRCCPLIDQGILQAKLPSLHGFNPSEFRSSPQIVFGFEVTWNIASPN